MLPLFRRLQRILLWRRTGISRSPEDWPSASSYCERELRKKSCWNDLAKSAPGTWCAPGDFFPGGFASRLARSVISRMREDLLSRRLVAKSHTLIFSSAPVQFHGRHRFYRKIGIIFTIRRLFLSKFTKRRRTGCAMTNRVNRPRASACRSIRK